MRTLTRVFACLLLSAAAALSAAELPGDARGTIDRKVAEVLKETGAPGASLAIVRDGAIVYAKAYGIARLGPPPLPAAESMRYSIGSISKQFTAAAILLLAEEGKVSLDDRVVRWLPGPDAGEGRHDPPASLDDVRLPGLLAAGLRHAADEEARHGRGHPRRAGRRSRSTSSPARNGSTATRITSRRA